jgi:hypothetical protein
MIQKAFSQLIALIVGCYTFLGVCIVCGVLTVMPAGLASVFTGGFTYNSLKRWEVSIFFLLPVWSPSMQAIQWRDSLIVFFL